MFFTNSLEFIVILIFTLLFNVVKWLFPLSVKLRSVLLLVGSYLILSLIVDPNTLLILSLMMIAVYGVAGILLTVEFPGEKKKKLLTVSLTGLIMLFCVRNYTWLSDIIGTIGFQNTVSQINLVGRIGLSYILFRLLHFLVDAYRNKIQNLGLIPFLNYIFFFPTYLSGPIDRYNNFVYWQNHHRSSVSLNMIYQGSARLLIGASKKLIIVPLILPFIDDISAFDGLVSRWEGQMLLATFAYSFYIYFDFSGYSDIAIGSAYLLGVKTPENFNNPYMSRDIAEFWKKWHMSFSSVLTEYIFKPFVIGLSKARNKWPRLLVSITGYIYTFIVCGLWHGTTLNFVYWGIWHGLGLAIFKSWETYMPVTEVGMKRKIRAVLSVGITFVFVTVGWFFFMSDTTKVHDVVKNKISFLNNDYMVDNERFSVEEYYFDGYGWGISVNYPSDTNKTFDVEMKKLGDDTWQLIEQGRNGKYAGLGIHGEIRYGNDTRNVEHGTYVVRMKESDRNYWIGNVVNVRNHKNK